MTKQQLFTIAIEDEEFPVKLYLDEFSANVDLREHFTEYWIETKQARVVPIEAISYKEKAIRCWLGTYPLDATTRTTEGERMTNFTIHWGSMFIGVCIGCFATMFLMYFER